MRRGAGKLVLVLLAVAWAAGLRAAVRSHDRSSGAAMDDSGEMTAETRELVRRLPSLAPPLEELGAADAEGADAKTVITLLRAERTDELEKILEGMEEAFERSPARESGVERLLDGLSFARTRELAILDRWVKRAPRSFAARAARGAARLTAFERSRTPANCHKSEGNQDIAVDVRDDLEKALELRPGFVPGMTLMMKAMMTPRDSGERRRLLDRAYATCPTCTGPSVEYLLELLSDGESTETARSFAEQAQSRVEAAPRLRALMGYLDWDEAGRLLERKDWEGALAACDRALASYPEPEFAHRKGLVLLAMTRYQDAVEALSTVLDARPYDVEARVGRARAYVDSKRYRPASDDLRLVLQLEPDHSFASTLYGWLVTRFEYEIQRELRSAALERALETYDEALDAVPEHSEFRRARRAVATRLGVPSREPSTP